MLKTYRVNLKNSENKYQLVQANTWFEAREKGCALFGADRDNVIATEVEEPTTPRGKHGRKG